MVSNGITWSIGNGIKVTFWMDDQIDEVDSLKSFALHPLTDNDKEK